MSILIKDMKMPHNCGECWIPCTVEFLDRQLSQRPKCCPCFEVKIPHGRLIDADELFKEMERKGWFDNADRDEAEDLVLDAPTIIEAEEVET